MTIARRRRVPDPNPDTYSSLAAYIKATGESQANIARRVGTSQAHISRIAAGDAVPRSLLAARIAAYCHVPLDSFTRANLGKIA